MREAPFKQTKELLLFDKHLYRSINNKMYIQILIVHLTEILQSGEDHDLEY